jgi:hypothetical protein
MLIRTIKKLYKFKNLSKLKKEHSLSIKDISNLIITQDVQKWEISFFKRIYKDENAGTDEMFEYLQEYYQSYYTANKIELDAISTDFLYDNKFHIYFLKKDDYIELLDFIKTKEHDIIAELNERMKRALYEALTQINTERFMYDEATIND